MLDFPATPVHLSPMSKLSIDSLQLRDKEVLMRADFNVPLKEGAITDDTRIQAAIPSIKHLLEGGAKLVLCSHLGRPDGQPNPKYSLAPVAKRLSEILGSEVKLAPDCIGDETNSLRNNLAAGQALLLENTRFHSQETDNDSAFAKQLAGQAEIFVNDAFGAAHRAHASTEGVTHHIPTCAMGFLLALELKYLVDQLKSPERPFLVIMGGAKVSGKIDVITNLIEKADAFIIGGAMAYTFRKAQGYEIGDSLVENDKLDLALSILKLAEEKNVRFLLPPDSLITQEFKEGAETQTTKAFGEGGAIPAGWEGVDIGPLAMESFTKEIATAKTIVWNGPMGVFEIDTFANGTKAVAQALADSPATTIVGGGDSVTAVNKLGLEDKMTFISTGGGASLELLEGKDLPGVAALDNA